MKRVAVAALLVLGSPASFAAEDASKHYAIATEALPAEVAAGEKGVVAIQIVPKGKAYVHEQAPLKMSAAARNLKLDKDAFGRADAQRKDKGARFEVAYTAEKSGPAAVDADLTFFICTEKLCERQQRKVSVPVTVK